MRGLLLLALAVAVLCTVDAEVTAATLRANDSIIKIPRL